MTDVNTLLYDAYREANLIANGASLTTNEETEGLRFLNQVVDALYAQIDERPQTLALGSAGITTPELIPVYMDDIISYYVPSNTVLNTNLAAAVTVNLNPQPKDGEIFSIIDQAGNFATYNLTVEGNGRNIEDAASLVLDTDSLIRTWFYRADTGNWARLSDLDISSGSPFPRLYDPLISIGIAARINPRNGAVMDQLSSGVYNTLNKQFLAQYRQTRQVPTEQGIVRLPSNRRWRDSFSSDSDFSRGVPIW